MASSPDMNLPVSDFTELEKTVIEQYGGWEKLCKDRKIDDKTPEGIAQGRKILAELADSVQTRIDSFRDPEVAKKLVKPDDEDNKTGRHGAGCPWSNGRFKKWRRSVSASFQKRFSRA